MNQYGELCPQQDKALEELGFELPKPNEKKGKYNNRKMVFDEECRKLFISICQNHGLTIDVEPVWRCNLSGEAGFYHHESEETH